MEDIASQPVSGQGSRRPAAHALVHGPRFRAVRSLLEIAELREEQRELVSAALAKARKRRDRPLATLLEAALLTNRDLAAEIDAAGLALGQIGALWAHGDDGGGAA